MIGPTKNKNETKRQPVNFHLFIFNFEMDLQVMLVTLIETIDMSFFVTLAVIRVTQIQTLIVVSWQSFHLNVVYNFVIFVPLALMYDAMVPLPTTKTAF